MVEEHFCYILSFSCFFFDDKINIQDDGYADLFNEIQRSFNNNKLKSHSEINRANHFK